MGREIAGPTTEVISDPITEIMQVRENAVPFLASKPAELPRRFASAAEPPLVQPVVDEISVEKDEVCQGEENLISVKAHTLDGSDDYLHYVIGGEPGQSVPLKTYLLASGQLLRQRITVFGKRGASVTLDVPPYRVLECRPQRILDVRHRARANAIDELEFAVRIMEHPGNATQFRPVRYAWSFGDGATRITNQPFVIHDYSRRSQPQLYSSYLVHVKALADSGESVAGRTTIEFLNLTYQELKKFGNVTIVTQANPRFPVLSDDGVVRQKFDVWHYYSEPVDIQLIRVIQVDSGGRRRDSGAQMDVGRLSQTRIDPGDRVQIELYFDVKAYQDLTALVYKMEGVSTDRRLAHGEAIVMRPPPTPTRENSTPVSDRGLDSRIRSARRILGKDTVSLEDIWELERDGRLPSATQ